MIRNLVSRENLTILLWACSLAWLATTAAPRCACGSDLDEGFRTPADADKPWVYYWWLNGNVTEELIRRDLGEMKEKGIAGFLLFDARGYHDDHVPPPPSKMEFMGPEWRKMLKFTMTEAGRLGLKMSVNLSSCAGALKGPWTVGDDAPKKLVWATSEVEGPRQLRMALPAGEWGRSWEIVVMAARHASSPAGSAAKPVAAEVVDLSDRVSAEKQLVWDVPKGRWTVFRFACTIMEGREDEVDILDEKAVEGHFNRMGRAILADAGPLAPSTLTHFYSVSWEGAAPTWTPGFEQAFAKYRGYELRPYLPVLAGMIVNSQEVTDRFLRDYSRTIGDCFMDHCYGKLRTLCHAAGLKWHSESGGPWPRGSALFAHSDQLAFWARNDMPQGEFWWPGAKQTNARRTAMATHIYGLPLAAIEAFTHMRGHWSAYPAALKPSADAALCDGVNFFIWHTFTASLPEFGKPGREYFAGTHLNPNVTWWNQAGAFLAYLARCQHLLREGRFVADVGCYTSDRNYSAWSRGEKWGDRASFSLGRGYTYDLLNTEVLLDRVSVDRGDLVLPDGMRYRLLVVDLEDDAVQPAAIRKIVELAKAGATVVLGQRRPQRAAGLKGYPAGDDEVRRLADTLWGGDKGVRNRFRPAAGTAVDEILQSRGILPDFIGPYDCIHRRSDEADIYFLSGKGDAECTFRVEGKEPELWDPVTGRIRDAIEYRASGDGRTIVPIRLPENGSVFVVFRRPAEQPHLAALSDPEGIQIEDRCADGARLRLWRQGHYELKTSQDQRLSIDVEGLPEPQTVAGPWEVHFAPGGGAPDKLVFDRLIPWNEHPDEGVKYFSGTATYRKTFELEGARTRNPIRLHLGQVGQLAEVRLNGKPLGVVWTAPWTVDLTGAVRPGVNQLEISVTNVWANRLIGDAGLPPEKRLTKTNILLQAGPAKFPRYKGYSSRDALIPSGLMGPVQLEFGEQREVPLRRAK
jgi:hypothetical protein